ncbi:MAG: hypothetical protein RL701_3523 [Pseudomonadota bacterium]
MTTYSLLTQRVHSAVAPFGLCLLGFCLLGSVARADGEQMLPGGTQSAARGGASMARPVDNMTMLHNPAGLIELPGNQIMLQLDTAIDRVCVQPYGYYGWGVYLTEDKDGNTNNPDDHRSEFGDPASTAYGSRHLDRMCNSGAISGLPQLAVSFHVTPDLSVGFGFVAGTQLGLAQWGGKDGTIQTENGARPTPTRYQSIYTEALFALNPTASVAYRVAPWLALGATLQAAMISANSYLVMAMRAGTSPASDAMAKLHATDLFVPTLIVSAQAKPSRYLRFAGAFNWSEGMNGSGEMTITTNTYHKGAMGSELLPFQNDPVKLKDVRLAQPWTATLAARFAQPRGLPNDTLGVHDALVDELWDVEVDAALTGNRTGLPDNRVTVANDFTLEFRRADGTPQMPLTVSPEEISEIAVERHTLDVLTVRLGGSLNVLPGRLQLSLGGFFQTRGVEPSYASVDSFGFQRVGLGLGVLVRAGRFDLSASFAHIFSEALTIAPPQHEPRTSANGAPESGFDHRVYEDGKLSVQPRVEPAVGKADGVAKVTQAAVFESQDLNRRVVNAGRYTASFDVISIGAVYHF